MKNQILKNFFIFISISIFSSGALASEYFEKYVSAVQIIMNTNSVSGEINSKLSELNKPDPAIYDAPALIGIQNGIGLSELGEGTPYEIIVGGREHGYHCMRVSINNQTSELRIVSKFELCSQYIEP